MSIPRHGVAPAAFGVGACPGSRPSTQRARRARRAARFLSLREPVSSSTGASSVARHSHLGRRKRARFGVEAHARRLLCAHLEDVASVSGERGADVNGSDGRARDGCLTRWSDAKADTCTEELAFRAVSMAARKAFDKRVNLLATHERRPKHLKQSSTTWSKSSEWSSKIPELQRASWKLKNSMPFRSERNRSAACKFLKNRCKAWA
jgi:hypothetical protein